MTSLGERIKSLRLERDLQQRQLAEKADLTPSMVSQIESGRLTPSLHTLGRIAAALGVPIAARSEEHTSELQSLAYLVCRLLLEKKKKHKNSTRIIAFCNSNTKATGQCMN